MKALNLMIAIAVLYSPWAIAQRENSLIPSTYAAASGQAIAVHPDGGLVVAGIIRQPMARFVTDGFEDIFLAWLNADGNIERTMRFGSDGIDRLGDISIDAYANVYVAGDTTGTFPAAEGVGTQFIAKISPDAELLWIRQQYGGPTAYPAVTVVNRPNEILVAGSLLNGEGTNQVPRSPGFHPYYDAYLQTLDENGNELSFTRFAVDSTQFPTDIVPLESGPAMVVGIRSPEVLNEPYAVLAHGFTARLDFTSGTVLDSFPLGRQGNAAVQYRATPTIDGGILITFGTHNGVGTPDYDPEDEIGNSADAVIGLWQTDGEPIWIRDFGNARSYMGRGITQGNNDTVVVVGYGNGNLGGPSLGLSDAYVIAYSHSGERLWADRFGTPVFDRAEAIAAAPDGTIYVTGFLNGWWTDRVSGFRTGETWFIAAYKPDGQQLWLQQYAAGDISEKVE